MGPSGGVDRPLLRRCGQPDDFSAMSGRAAALKQPATASAPAVSEVHLPPAANIPPPALPSASGLATVDVHSTRPKAKKPKRKSVANAGQSEKRKKRKKESSQTGETIDHSKDDNGRFHAAPCANLLDSEGEDAWLQASGCNDSVPRTYLRAKLDELKARLGGEKALPKAPGANPARGVRARSRSEGPGEVLQTLRRRLCRTDAAPGDVVRNAAPPEAGDPAIALAKAIQRLVKGGGASADSDIFGGEGDDDPQEQPFPTAPTRACQDLKVQARRFPGRLLADALSSMRRFLGSRGGADTGSEELPRVLTYLETVFNQVLGLCSFPSLPGTPSPKSFTSLMAVPSPPAPGRVELLPQTNGQVSMVGSLPQEKLE